MGAEYNRGVLRIGRIQIDFPIVQAALSGYSDAPMRLVARRHGAEYALHEVVLDKLVLQSSKRQRKLLEVPAADHPVGGQLLGAEPREFALAAVALAEAGFDVIDINFGCPVRKVLGRCRGGFLLTEPSTAIEIVRQVRAALPVQTPVTVKMRRGADDTPESERRFFDIFDAALELGVAAFTVHGRTVAQRYDGPSTWSFLTRLRRHAPQVTLLGSGDLFTPQDCVRMMSETGVDGVTVARGCIGNPWIFREARALWSGAPLPEPPSVAEQGRTIREHYELSEVLHGPDRAGQLMRKFGIKYSRLHPHALQVRDAFIRAANPAEWRAVLDEWYDPAKNWPPVPRPSPDIDLLTSCS